MKYEYFLWRNNKPYLSKVISQKKEKYRMEKGGYCFRSLALKLCEQL